MILQQLYRDAADILKQTGRDEPPSMYDMRPVRWVIELPADERLPFNPLTDIIPTPGESNKGIKRLVPNAVRSSGIRPLLLADKPTYVLGVRIADTKLDANRDVERDQARAQQEHEAFREIVARCAEVTDDPDVAVVARFLAAWNPENIVLPPDMTRDHLITFRVCDAAGGIRYPVDNAAVQAFWAGAGREGIRRAAAIQRQRVLPRRPGVWFPV